jgi:hypothetical protein
VIDKVSTRLIDLRAMIIAAAKKCGRNPDEISLIGVSKTRSAEEVVEVIRAGLTDFGENRVLEAFDKKQLVLNSVNSITDRPTIKWHLIGHLQSNKVNKAVGIFDVIHSIDSCELARKVGEASRLIGKRLDCYVQINTSGENSKSGTNLAEAESVATAVFAERSLNLVGFMTIGPLTNDMKVVETCFNELRRLRDRLSVAHPDWGNLGLSMGMSGDFELAIACGATAVRVGSALFGERDYYTKFNRHCLRSNL